MNRVSTVMLTGVAMLCGCSQAGVDIAAERAALRAAADAYHAAGQQMNADAFAGSYTSDAVLMAPNESAANGADGARAIITAFAEGANNSLEFADMQVDVAASGDMGYTLAEAMVNMEGPDGRMLQETLRDFHLWRKVNGEWKIAVDIWNAEAPAAPIAGQSVDPISDALSATWPGMVPKVMVMDWEGNMLKEGASGYTCMPTPPMLSGTSPMCLDEEWQEWADAWANKKPYTADRLGIAYMLAGDEGASNIDPYAEGPTENNEWIREGAHLMIVAPSAMLSAYPTDPDNGGPYVMWKGSPYAHLMVPVGSRD